MNELQTMPSPLPRWLRAAAVAGKRPVNAQGAVDTQRARARLPHGPLRPARSKVRGAGFSMKAPQPSCAAAGADLRRAQPLSLRPPATPGRPLAAGLVVLLHVAALFAFLQADTVREIGRAAAPVYLRLIEAAPAPPAPAPPDRPRPAAPPPVTVPQAIVAPIESIPITPAGPTISVTVDTGEPSAPTEVAAAEAPGGASTAASASPPTLLDSEVGYLLPPQVTYPVLARRLGEEGRVVLRVLVDPTGQPQHVIVATSSGFARLDEAARLAAHSARFRPYVVDGQARAVWVLMPFGFRLERG